MVGIYKITNPSGKVYIGQSWNIEKRFKYYYKKGCKNQVKLYNSIIKYGSDNHIYKVIHELPKDITQLVLDSYEQFYIDSYKNVNIEVLNIRDGGSRGKWSEESKNKFSEILSPINKIRAKTAKHLLDCSKGGKTNIGRKNNLSVIEKMIISKSKNTSISCFKINGEFVGNYISQSDCARQLNINQSGISFIFNGRLKTYKGYIFKKDNYEFNN